MNRVDIKRQAQSAESVWSEAYDVLWKLINKNRLKVGAEIGVAFAGHSERILQKTRSKLYCIDPYQHIRGYDDPMNKSQTEFDLLFQFAQSRLAKYRSRVTFIRQKSQAAITKIQGEIDYVYIDADHSYQGVREDIRRWFFKIRDGGIIAGHDYNHPNFPGVKRAVDEFFDRFGWKVTSYPSGVWWVKKEPLPISFIIPAYNASQTIEESVLSIINTNFTANDEIIIVNDGSSDNTSQKLTEIQKKYRFIKIFSHYKNQGGGPARNTAVMRSKHQLLFCLDADNVLLPGSITKLKQCLIAKGADCASFDTITYFQNKGRKKTVTHTWRFAKRNYQLKDYFSTFKVPGASGNYLYTRQSFDRCGGYPTNSGALDAWGFGFRQAADSQLIVTLPGSSYLHRISNHSYWTLDSKKRNMSLAALKIIWPYLHKVIWKDQWYILTFGLTKWFDNLPSRPIHVKE